MRLTSHAARLHSVGQNSGASCDQYLIAEVF
jgi:hypothetical protein